MKFGMTSTQFKMLEDMVITPLKSSGAKVYIFGSRVAGHQHSHSDVDLLYSLPEKKDLPAGFISNITESIEESRFPFKVDLVNEEELALSYRERVMSERIQV